MATALLVTAFIAAVGLGLIVCPIFDERPADEVIPSSFSQGSPMPSEKAYLHAADTQTGKMAGPVCPCDDDNDDRFRARFIMGPGVDVTGLPARGGRYVLIETTGVELDFLGLDRFRDSKRLPGAGAGSPEEEAHCDRMRRLGAAWWPSTHNYVEWRVGDIGGSPYVKVGWPAGGGAWVLSTTYDEAGDKGVAMIHNAYNMDERCKVLEKLGAVFYENPRDCPDLDLP